MGIITISRQAGSRGEEIAARVAEALGFTLIDRQIIGEETGLVTVDHDLEQVFGRHLGLEDRMQRLKRLSEYLQAVVSAVEEVARRQNVVILGRGAQVVLRDRPDTLHVKVVAPMNERVLNLIRRRELAHDEAERVLTEADETRRAFHQEVYGVDWNQPDLYDLIVNTARTDVESAAALIVWLARTRGIAPERVTPASR
ncbi:MAG: cytidylate kinase-like family protein [Armatimonadota bacterium]|nr:cytidylate kinase-like family protein [Armatimonadota bacterium]